jgi:hypothetical protein
MPKRTNEFQELIYTVYEQIIPKGGKVTESGMVFDKDSNTLREVDILVEYRYAHHDFKLAIECRDRSRKDSVQWIDELIGKTRSLAVNKVAAVSKEGFTESAVTKARAFGIDTLSVKEAVETDWQSYAIKPGIIVFSGEKFRLHDVLFKEGQQYRSLRELGLCSIVEKDGEKVGLIKETFEYFFQKFLLPSIQNKVSTDFMNFFKKKEDITKTLYIESDHIFPGFSVCLDSGDQVDISNLKFKIYGSRTSAEVEQTDIKFNDLMVSTGQYLDTDGSVLKFTIIQDPETKEIHTKIKRQKPEDSSPTNPKPSDLTGDE